METVIGPETVSSYGVRPRMFDTLQEAYDSINDAQRKGMKLCASRIWVDFFDKPPGRTGRFIKLFGVSPKAERICKDFEPTGKWRVEFEEIEASPANPRMYRMTAWFDRFLPYAFAMMQAENGFECRGIDSDSINTLYHTIGGFMDLGFDHHRIVDEDRQLFSRLYHACNEIKSPSLIFYEVYRPCAVFVAFRNPKVALKALGPDHWMIDFVREVAEHLGDPIPEGFQKNANQ